MTHVEFEVRLLDCILSCEQRSRTPQGHAPRGDDTGPEATPETKSRIRENVTTDSPEPLSSREGGALRQGIDNLLR